MENRYDVSDGNYECNHKDENFGLRDSNPIKMYGDKKQKRLARKMQRNDVWKTRDEISTGTSSSTYQEQLNEFRRQKGINAPQKSQSSQAFQAIRAIIIFYVLAIIISACSSIFR